MTGFDLLVCPRSGQRLRLETLEEDGHGVRFGILHSDSGHYPVVHGIPIFLDGHERVVELLRAGRMQEATASAVLSDLPPSRRQRVVQALATAAGGRAGAACASWLDRRGQAEAARAIFRSDGSVSTDGVLRLVYLDSAGRSVDAYNYFNYRFSSPRHLVALSCVDALPPLTGPVLDVGCGAGHMTWALQTQLVDRRIVAVDKAFSLVLAARELLGPDPLLACADAASLPFDSASFSLVFASDVLSFITPKWQVARELVRLLGADGWLMLTSLKNSLQRHVYEGEPLPPDGWRRLVGDLDACLYPDTLILRRYLDRLGLPRRSGITEEAVRDSRMVSLVATNGAWHLREDRRFGTWPHGRGRLGVNPLYRPAGPAPDGGVRYERAFPPGAYAADNPEMVDYLPAGFVLPAGALDQGEGPIEPLLSSLGVLGLPAAAIPPPPTPPGRRRLARRALDRLLRSAARVGWHPPVRITDGVARGLRISLRQASADYSRGTNELPVQEALAARLEPGAVFYDVGSNIGFFAMIAARLVGASGRVYAFEPVPANAECIRANARRNHLANLEVVQAAVGSTTGTARLHLTRHPGGATLSEDLPTDCTSAIDVPLISLDDLVKAQRAEPPTVVKIDVEGFELDVLAGMEHLLDAYRPVVIFELDDAEPAGLERKIATLGQAFAEHDYALEALAPSYVEDAWNVAHAVAAPAR